MTHPGKIIALSGRDLQSRAVKRKFKPEPELTRLQGYMALWREGWDPAPRDERWMRILAGISTLLMHLLLLALLVVIAVVQMTMPPVSDDRDGERIRIGIVDAATSEQDSEAGGGEPDPAHSPAPVARPVATAGAAAEAPSSASASPDQGPSLVVPDIRMPSLPQPADPIIAPPVADVVQRLVAEPEVPVPQPVQVTVVETPTSDHVLPPVNAIPRIEIPVTPVRPNEAQVQLREVAVVIPPTVTAPQVRIEVSQPTLSGVEPAVREREVTAPLSQVPLPQTRMPVVANPRLERTSVPEVRQRDIEVRLPATATVSADTLSETEATQAPAATTSPATGDAPSHTSASTSTDSPPHAPRASAPGTQGQGNAASRSDGWGQAPRSDDWSANARSDGRQHGQSGTSNGLFDADGRVNLGDAGSGKATADAGTGTAPGSSTDHWNRDRLDRSGSWLRSPPNDFTPTSFDAYWIPSESLLSEWVRNGIKEISIPIPGTRTRLQCVISILQVGGGCGFHNPNLNDQPAVARPSPEIPFKPELQEDNGSIGTPQQP